MAVNLENGMDQLSASWDFKGQADYVGQWFLMGSPRFPIIIITTYLLFVLRIGPAYMKGRPPFHLQNILLAYDGVQVLISIFLFSLGIQYLSSYGIFQTNCLYSQEEIRKEILTKSYWYAIAKLTELLDTVFFVLRKKQKQVNFLHVYHHTFAVVISWFLLKYGKGDDLVFVWTVNSFVHIWMYAYYGLSGYPGLVKFLWWKKYLTSLQLVQFVLVLIYIALRYITSKCPPSGHIIGLTLFNGFLFIYLFSNFYKNAYGDKKNMPYEDDNLSNLDCATASFIKNAQTKYKK